MEPPVPSADGSASSCDKEIVNNEASLKVTHKPHEIKGLEKQDSPTTHANTLSVPSVPRLPRANGYGDFCFGKRDRSAAWYMRLEKGGGFVRSPYRDYIYTRSYEGFKASFSSKFGFQRSGPFMLLKLPLEIRRKIYRMILQPFFLLDPDTNKYVFYATLQKNPSAIRSDSLFRSIYGNCYSGGFEKYWAKFIDGQNPLLITEELRRHEEMKYSQRKKEFRGADAGHPERSYPYSLTTFVPTAGVHMSIQDWMMLDVLRHLSNLSTQVRDEIGSVLWDNTCLRVNGTKHNETTELILGFLQERPAIHKSIKNLLISFDFLQGQAYKEGDIIDISGWCQYMAQNVELNFLTLELHADKNDLDQLGLGEGPLQIFSSLRLLNVRSEFKLRLFISEDGYASEDFDDREDYDEHCACLVKKYREATRKIIMPDTLRRSLKIDLTDDEKYLSGREKTTSSAESTAAASKDDEPWDAFEIFTV